MVKNKFLKDKPYLLQSSSKGFRCIFWGDEELKTPWREDKESALNDGEDEIKAINNFQNVFSETGE